LSEANRCAERPMRAFSWVKRATASVHSSSGVCARLELGRPIHVETEAVKSSIRAAVELTLPAAQPGSFSAPRVGCHLWLDE
jgi:hypothetical protein